jgi:hypothetical protein
MRHEFEKKMAQSNTWYKQEQEAIETARRLALENEYVAIFQFPLIPLRMA